ncbi:MAG: hypothetical protein FWG99_04610 [Treponema sp.]|nr:hypothetical protein [Treponema sp.]
MKKPAVLCLLILSAGLLYGPVSLYGQESVYFDFAKNLNATIGDFLISENEQFLLLPSLYLSRKHQIYISFGLMLAPLYETLYEYEDEEYTNDPVLNAAFYLKRRKSDMLLIFNYYRDESWGIRVKLKF